MLNRMEDSMRRWFRSRSGLDTVRDFITRYGDPFDG